MASSSQQPQLPENPEEFTEPLIFASTNNVALARKSLVGRVLASKLLNKNDVKDILSKVWSN